MRRAGGWILGLLVAAAMAGGGWIGLRPILNRETLVVRFVRGERDPSSDAMLSGLRFALDEVGGKAGPCRIELLETSQQPGRQGTVFISVCDPFLIEARVQEPDFGVPIKRGGTGPEPIRVLPTLRELGEAAAAWVLASGATRTVLLCDEKNRFSQDIADGYDERSRPVPARLDTMGEEGTPALLDRVLLEKPDLVFYAGEAAPFGRAFELFEGLRKRGYAGRLVMGDADPEVSYLAVPARVVEGTILISPIGPPSAEFAAAYEPATGRHAGPHAWPGYLMMKALLAGIDRTGSCHWDKLRAAFEKDPPKPRPCALYVARDGKFAFLQDLK